MIIEVTAGVKIYAHTDISSLKNEAIGYFRRTVAAVASRGSLKMDVALTNVNKAWKIVRPEHLWCRLTNLLPGTQDVAVQNFRRVQPFIEQAWAKGKLVNMDNQGSVLKEHMIGDALVRVIGWFERTAEGTIRISDAWVQR
jgi:hypothetical protein